jgi:hypothetical protein
VQHRPEVGLQQVSTEGYQHGPGQDYPIEEFIRPKQFADQQVQAADHHCDRQNEKQGLSHGELYQLIGAPGRDPRESQRVFRAGALNRSIYLDRVDSCSRVGKSSEV